MTKLTVFILSLVCIPLSAQKLFLYPTAAVAPRGSYQTVTAIITGVNDKTVTWTASGGKIVGTNPCIVNEPCTIALFSTEPGKYTLKATSNANHSETAVSNITFTPSPTPVTTHPRLIVTAAMLPELQAKAISKNVIYQSIKTRAESALERDNATWSWTCKGGTGEPSSDQSQNYKEYDANLFAFLSMVASTPAERKDWGCYSRDVWVYVMKQVLAKKEQLGGNHWSDSAPQLALTTDWLMGGNYLSPADQALAHRFFAMVVPMTLNYSYGVSAPPEHYNSSSQFNSHMPTDLIGMRAMGNNYTMTKMLYAAAGALTFNDNANDDPALPNSCHATREQVCSDFTAGSLHAYWNYFVGGMLYRMNAHLEDPTVAWQAYQASYKNLPTAPTCLYMDGSSHPCFGDGRGGESSEGSWYSGSLARLREALNLVHTAGYDDPLLYGPQMSLANSSWWDMRYITDIEFLTTFSKANEYGVSSSYSYLTTGDSLSYSRSPSDFITEAKMMTTDFYTGRTDRRNALKWVLLNTAFGGPSGTLGGCSQHCGFDSELSNDYASALAIDLMIALPAGDPVASLPPDPRPSLPLDLYNGSFNQHSMLRSGWNQNATLFSYYCPNATNDHEHQFCGRFDIVSKGEYVTKGRTEFNDYNDRMSSAPQQNIASILNITGSNCSKENNCIEANAVLYGGQFWHAEQAGLLALQHSELSRYAAYIVDTTKAYNGMFVSSSPYDVPGFNDVTKASRSLIYLREINQVVFYDRAATRHAAEKAVYQITTGTPAVSGPEASWLTRSKTQKVYLTTLLPQGIRIADAGLAPGGPNQKNDWEVAGSVKVSAGSSLTAQFLSVMEWGSSSFVKTPTSLVQSTAGQNFDGARVGTSLVMFMRNWPSPLTSVTYAASGATTQYISDLFADTKYAISGAGAPASGTTDTAGVLTFSAAGTGNITVSALATK